MKTFAICFVALFAVVFGRSVSDDYGFFNDEFEFDGNGPDFGDEVDQIDNKIIGGTETTIEQHPHQLSLRIYHSHNCGASILTPVKAISVAHCLRRNMPPSVLSIQAGSTVRIGDSRAQLRRLTRFVMHARYNNPPFANDISILFWKKPLTFGVNVRPIQLPTANATVPYGQNATASGWGYTRLGGPEMAEILKEVTAPLVSNEDCNLKHRGSVTADMVCAGGEAGQGGCNGDSGGPLVHNNTLIGMTSWGFACSVDGHPSVYTRVAFFIDWITQNID